MGVYLEFRDLGRCWAVWGGLFNYQTSNRYQLININYIIVLAIEHVLPCLRVFSYLVVCLCYYVYYLLIDLISSLDYLID